MTLQEFLTKWNGKYCEVAGSANAVNQCVDLANAYIRDVLGLPIIEWTNAKDFPSRAGDKYTYILNSPTGVPKEGDIVIWKPTPGHIAIFLEGTANSFKSFDQNFPTGSPCHVQTHNYTNVTGWLRAKGTPISDQECMPKSQAEDYRRVKEGWNQLRAVLNVEDSVTVVVAEVKKLISYEDTVVQKDKQLSDAQSEIASLRAEVTRLQEVNTTQAEEVTNLKTEMALQASVLTDKASDLEEKYKVSTQNYGVAMSKIKELEDKISKPESTGWQKIVDGFFEILGRS